eukprot:355265-Chlamydomonas_euryale.AAC.10
MGKIHEEGGGVTISCMHLSCASMCTLLTVPSVKSSAPTQGRRQPCPVPAEPHLTAIANPW